MQENNFGKFKAAMFDFDGTITKKGRPDPEPDVIEALFKLTKKMPIAFCTGRQLESFEKRGLTALLRGIDVSERQAFLENVFLMAENGSIGYYFNTDIDEFEEFYRIEWPEDFINKEEFRNLWAARATEWGLPFYDAHRVIVVMRTILYGKEGADIDEVYRYSRKIYDVAEEILSELSEDFWDYLHVGNSGIGVMVCPASGDKDNGIKKFSEILKEKRNIDSGPNAREILVVGDQAMPGGNDYYFLNGNFGTAFTVGSYGKSKQSPSPVVTKDGERLYNAKGTMYLIDKLLD